MKAAKETVEVNLPELEALLERSAEVGDLYMSLIHTCELNNANPFDYLTELQKHADELAQNPAAWMPWNYRQTLEQTGRSKPTV